MNYVFDPNNCPRKEAKLIIDLLNSAGSHREVLELVFHAGRVSRDLERPLDSMHEVIEDATRAIDDLGLADFNDEIWFNVSLARITCEQLAHFKAQNKPEELIWRTYDRATIYLAQARLNAARVGEFALDWVQACHEYANNLMRK